MDDDTFWDRYHVSGDNNLAWGIIYEEPGLRKDSGLSRKLEWLTWWWRPNSSLCGLFRQIGLEKHGEGLVEIWADEVEGYYFPLRDEFEYRIYSYDPGHVPLSR